MISRFLYSSMLMMAFIAGPMQAQDKRVERLTFNYIEVAFWKISEFESERLMKWTDKKVLNYRIIGEMPWMSEKEWLRFLDEVSELTGLAFVPVDDDSYDILLFFGMLEQYEIVTGISIPKEAKGYGNWSNRFRNKQYGLTRASFCIDPISINFSNFGKYRIKRFFLGTLGILGAVSDVNSLFWNVEVDLPNGSTHNLTRSDKRLVKLHYMDFIPAGIDVRELRKIIFRNQQVAELAYEKL